MFKLDKGRAKYDLRKYYFTNRVVNAWNSLPDHVVLNLKQLTLLNHDLINFGNIKIYLIISKQNFTEPEVAVYIVIRY